MNVDALGNPLRFLLTGGQRHDITQAEDLIAGYEFERVIADRAYDSDDLLRRIAEQEAEAVIPLRKNRKEQRDYDKHLYKERHLVECFFNKIKHYRRLFSRFEKTGQALSWLFELWRGANMVAMKCQHNLGPRQKISHAA